MQKSSTLTFGAIRDTGSKDCHVADEIGARVRLPDVSTERAARLVTREVETRDFGVVEVEVLVSLSVGAKRGIILEWREINGSALVMIEYGFVNNGTISTYTSPPSDHAGTSELRGAVGRVIGQELVELGDKLLELAESEERAILGPGRSSSDRVPSLIQKENTGREDRLTREWSVETTDGRLGDAVQEPKI